ncbi:MAG: ATP-binding cassette domain-containing protein, partial [Oscillospiraceae bacterium]
MRSCCGARAITTTCTASSSLRRAPPASWVRAAPNKAHIRAKAPFPALLNCTPLVRYLTSGVQFTDGYRDLCRRASPSVHKIFILFLLPFCNFFYIIPYGDIIRRSPTGFVVSNAAGRVSGNEGYDMIRLKDVEKTYENGTEALQGISFTIEDGEFVFLVGPSGSGKSTIIKLLTGEVIPTAG